MSLDFFVIAIPLSAVVLLPFFLRRREAWDLETTPERFQVLERAYGRLLRTLKDLEFEFQVGNLSGEEHTRLKAEYKRKAVAVRKLLGRARLSAVRRIAQGKSIDLTEKERGRLESMVAEAGAGGEKKK